MDIQQIQSYNLGFTDGQACGAHLLTTYDKNQLVELLRDPKFSDDESFFLGFLKSRVEISRDDLEYQFYLDGFHAGYRDSLELDSENLDIGGEG
jgi:hypothetical protein